MTERQKENIENLKKLRAMIKKDMKTTTQVKKLQEALENLTPAGEKAMASEIADFKKFRRNVLARGIPDTPLPKRAMASKEGGPKTPTKLPKPKPKRPTQVAAAKKKPSGVTFDTSGTLPGKTIKRMNNGGAVMSGRGGKFKGIS